MGLDELDQLKTKNEARIAELNKRLFNINNEVAAFKNESDEQRREIGYKERFKDSSQAYPTYGRGMHPSINMNTFMIQPSMTGEVKKKSEGAEFSPEITQQTKQRQRIVSPKRKRFEKHFDEFLKVKYVEKPLVGLPEKQRKIRSEPPEFDTTTKWENSLNVKVPYNKRVAELQKWVTLE